MEPNSTTITDARPSFERLTTLMSLAQEAGAIAGMSRPSRSRTSRPFRGKAGGAVVSVALALLAAFLLFIAYGSFVENRWYRVVAIEGGSMEPTFATGDAIVITRPPAQIRPGMVLTLEIKGKVVTHRVVSVAPDGTPVTKGDANTYADDWSGLRVHVVGLYRGKIPLIGRVLEGVRTGAWFTDRETVDASVTSGEPAP